MQTSFLLAALKFCTKWDFKENCFPLSLARWYQIEANNKRDLKHAFTFRHYTLQ